MRSVKQKALLFSALFSLTVFASQAAFAQSDPLAGIYSPTRDALTEFAVSIAGSIPKIIAATILLVIGFAGWKDCRQGCHQGYKKYPAKNPPASFMIHKYLKGYQTNSTLYD
ncbi:hypothetical protein QVH35_01225 [Candidatus Nitrosotenuis chungbukensis]|uniref:hypothetical protein n=1 Tax=Candidatus Nitrosotenuis chungbukensis TaxID=1353246 RepID=UPI0026723989|nr:hypothetical protein [Candidatus Nitrosotenuis chungbukensis]WKT58162.1 hypothetical protein QVH35_01225 [Candidatus Nitrosotenuis chungbukensis]